MAFTEFYVTQDVLASYLNGGSGTAGPKENTTALNNIDAVSIDGTYYTLENKDNDGWGTTAVDDFGLWDVAGTKERFRVVELNYGADADVIRIIKMTAITADTGKTVNIGGAWEALEDSGNGPANFITTSFVNAAGDPPRVNIGPGTYAEEVTIANTGTVAIPLTFEGYYATTGDECDNSGTFDPPIIEGQAASDHTIIAGAGIDYLRIRNLKITAQTNAKDCINADTDASFFDRLWLKTTGTTADGLLNAGNFNVYSDSYVESVTGGGLSVGIYAEVRNCYIRKADTYGISVGAFSAIDGCIVEDVVNDCILITNYRVGVHGCTLYSSTGGSGIKINNAYRGISVTNTIFDTMNQYAIEAVASCFITEANNAIRTASMGVGTRLNILSDPIGEVNHTADPFTNAAGHDFSLNSAATGGTLLKATGFPGTMLDGTNIGYRDIGALQSALPTDEEIAQSIWEYANRTLTG